MCVMDQLRALIWSEQLDSIYGMFSSACTKDGRYKTVQCNDVTGYCWCVDSRGNELWGTRVRGKAPECVNNPKNITECTKSLQGGQQRVDYFIGRFVPRCDSNGAYKPVQCDPSGYCWCVDRYGQELPRTKAKGIPKSCGLFGKFSYTGAIEATIHGLIVKI
ncbi:equistatin [Exaiptasia diaphana]|uniref:Thyroglobulin type-1 domain-containing protein n=1 Tax=Exaiptasia diaphana TaxID=2652724 RepID=A0A913WZP9_EXADI|nr:equistatin [Exaiptasia diaphana]